MLYQTVLLDVLVVMVPLFSLTTFLFTIPYCYAVHIGVCYISGQPVGTIWKGQAVQEDCFTAEDGTDSLSWNIGKHTPTYAV